MQTATQNPKSQFSSTNQISIFSDQNKQQGVSINANKLHACLLKIGHWCLIGAWYLALGIFSITFAAEFRTNHEISYDVDETGSTHVAHTITLENLTPNHYTTDYTLSLNPKGLENVQVLSNSPLEGGQTQVLRSNLNPTGLEIIFDDMLISQDKTRSFTIEYDDSDAAQKIGRLWKVDIPAFNSSTKNAQLGNYSISVNVPESFGPLHYSTPQKFQTTPAAVSGVRNFALKDIDANKPITFVFGDYQVYDFTLKYRITPVETPRRGVSSMQAIILPPNFKPYQEVFVKSLNPLPEKIKKDGDGNVLAYYKTPSKEPLSIIYSGQFRIDNTPPETERQLLRTPQAAPSRILDQTRDGDGGLAVEQDVASSLTSFTLPDKYWETTDPKIKNLAADLKTPRRIYDYVTQNLTYNQTRINTDSQDFQRYGAAVALEHKDNAVCTEFTDLTITLLRAANIPAREVNGYAYVADQASSDTQRPTISDVLHAWVVYFDGNTGSWRQIDPTWGSTTHRDYFETLDTDHIILTIKGLSSQGPYPTGDIKIKPTDTIISDVSSFETWLENFNHQNLPWYKKLILWINNLFKNR